MPAWNLSYFLSALAAPATSFRTVGELGLARIRERQVPRRSGRMKSSHMPLLDVDFVRGQFPAFSEPSLRDWAFFENAGGSYPCRQVVERLDRYYRQTKVQPYGAYPASREAGRAMDESHRRMAGYLNVDADEVLFGPSTSQNTYVLAQAFRGMWSAGDEIVVSQQDHEANAGAWRRLANHGIVVRQWAIDSKTGLLDPSDLDQLLTSRTRAVAFPHCSNVIAHINPVARIVEKAHAAGALTIVDGVAQAPHGFPDLSQLGADVYLFSLYKTYGPHQGLMHVRRELLEKMPNQGHFFNAAEGRKKLAPAGPDHAQVAAAAGIAEYFDAVYAHHFNSNDTDAAKARRVHELFQGHERTQLRRLLDWLAQRDDVRIIGPADAEVRAPTVSLVPLRRAPSEVVAGLVGRRIMAGNGDFYAVRPLEALGVPIPEGVVRVSFLHYTSADEIDRLVGALDESL